jgi:hypothetical protein
MLNPSAPRSLERIIRESGITTAFGLRLFIFYIERVGNTMGALVYTSSSARTQGVILLGTFLFTLL